jgi:hypothetical protein
LSADEVLGTNGLLHARMLGVLQEAKVSAAAGTP